MFCCVLALAASALIYCVFIDKSNTNASSPLVVEAPPAPPLPSNARQKIVPEKWNTYIDLLNYYGDPTVQETIVAYFKQFPLGKYTQPQKSFRYLAPISENTSASAPRASFEEHIARCGTIAQQRPQTDLDHAAFDYARTLSMFWLSLKRAEGFYIAGEHQNDRQNKGKLLHEQVTKYLREFLPFREQFENIVARTEIEKTQATIQSMHVRGLVFRPAALLLLTESRELLAALSRQGFGYKSSDVAGEEYTTAYNTFFLAYKNFIACFDQPSILNKEEVSPHSAEQLRVSGKRLRQTALAIFEQKNTKSKKKTRQELKNDLISALAYYTEAYNLATTKQNTPQEK